LAFGAAEVFRRIVEWKSPDPTPAFETFAKVVEGILMSNNAEAMTVFLDHGGHLPSLLASPGSNEWFIRSDDQEGRAESALTVARMSGSLEVVVTL
jgi:hypothetical protein